MRKGTWSKQQQEQAAKSREEFYRTTWGWNDKPKPKGDDSLKNKKAKEQKQ